MTDAASHSKSIVRVRRATDEDIPAIAEIHVRSWQAAYRGILPDELLDSLSPLEREQSWRTLLNTDGDRWLTLVAERPPGRLCGLCSVATPSHDPDSDEGTAEIAALYVAPVDWRRGVGSAMLTFALQELGERGWRSAILWVLPENRAALAFYVRFGFEVEQGVEKREERSGQPVIRLRATLASEPIEIVAYDPEWPVRFEEERSALDGVIGDFAMGGIHHVGSTAVPGLDAKPIIDILVGIESLDASRPTFDPLARLGYMYAPYLTNEMHWFCKPHPSRRTHHLHLAPIGGQRYRDELDLRDRLRANPDLAQRYADLKRSLARRFEHDREGYTQAKSAFINEVLILSSRA